jgi:Domain of unknown function (DUF6468)
MLALAVNGLIVLLLLLVLGRGFQLQRQFTKLRQQDGELDRLIAALNGASGRAEAALDGLRQTAEGTGERVTAQLTSAQRLIDDLQFLISRGEQAADRLVEQISRDRRGNQRGPGAAAVPDPVRAGDGPQRAGAELERTLRTLR